jgi:hypothetical protein
MVRFVFLDSVDVSVEQDILKVLLLRALEALID